MYVDSQDDLEYVIYQAQQAGLPCEKIVDNGTTEFGGQPTLTCCAIGPAWSDDIDVVTGHLPLY